MMKITEEIRQAISEACQSAGSQAEFARQTGLKPVYIGRYLSGKNKEISLENTLKIMPVIKPFLSTASLINGEVESFHEFVTGTSDHELECLRLEAKIAQLRLNRCYLSRKLERVKAELARRRSNQSGASVK